MIYLDLTFNLTLLVSLSLVSGFIENRWNRHTRVGVLLQGVLFGVAAILGMLRPLTLGPGLIFDGRSLMVSLCALFFGPWAATVSGALAIASRAWLGGTGMITGTLVILASAGIGLLAHFRLKPEVKPPSVVNLYIFGLAVHLAMLALMFTLPGGAGPAVVMAIGLPVILLYPLATILAGKILSDQVEAERVLQALQDREERYARLFNSSNDAISVHPLGSGRPGKFTEVNDMACARLGYSREELLDRSFSDIDAEGMDDARSRALETLTKTGQAVFEMVHVSKSGDKIPVEISSRVFESKGERYVLSIARDISDRIRAEEALRKHEAKTRAILDNIAIGVSLISPKMEILELNRRMRQWFPGIDPAQHPVCYRAFNDPPRAQVCDDCPTCQTLRDGLLHEATMQTSQGGGIRNYRIISSPILNAAGEVTAAIEMVDDITERLALESQVRQAQKMESIGRLAGAVAHDFNNMLGVIIGYTEFALRQVDKSQPLYAHLQEIQKAAERSADLTRQLLAFGRKQPVAPRVLDLNETVAGMLRMLRRLIGENIDLAWVPEAGLWPVKVDPSQIDQILANLCVNARDAIKEAGKVTIETHAVTFDKVYGATHPGFVPGDYVLLAVSDNGCGMDKEILGKLLEPFFTTKEKGKGTGLGLATVYGIVKQNDGFINVYSEPGHGTTFRVYLPRYAAEIDQTSPATPAAPAARGSETILLVEDELTVLDMARRILERLGYRVLATSTPHAALRAAKEHAGQIHLLIADVIMPDTNGKDLAQKLEALSPGMKQLFMSGYTGDVIARHGVLDAGVNYLQKPFTTQALAVKVREVLDAQ